MSLATDNALRERLREAGIARAKTFTWRRTAELTMNAYKQVLSR